MNLQRVMMQLAVREGEYTPSSSSSDLATKEELTCNSPTAIATGSALPAEKKPNHDPQYITPWPSSSPVSELEEGDQTRSYEPDHSSDNGNDRRIGGPTLAALVEDALQGLFYRTEHTTASRSTESFNPNQGVTLTEAAPSVFLPGYTSVSCVSSFS